ncbi:MAG: AzlC family ABC transporter permease [Atopobiaceae bacterium]|jgi:4-azaleucine resistance transporter AzlC|nr:AzlC family ABC transporter permease [Atopobiaceae bacterium]
MAAALFGGFLEFEIAGMLASPFAPLAVLSVTLAVQARHIFYGIAMLKRYEGTGWMRPYLIFGMCDETFSILASKEPPEGVDRNWSMFWVTLLDHMYWVTEAALGGLAGDIVPFSMEVFRLR